MDREVGAHLWAMVRKCRSQQARDSISHHRQIDGALKKRPIPFQDWPLGFLSSG
jgi:hypothetical protein